MNISSVQAVILDCIAEYNKQLGPNEQIEVSSDTVIVGEGGGLDSLTIITLLVSIETALADKLGIQRQLLDEQLLADPSGPLRNVAALTAWLA